MLPINWNTAIQYAGLIKIGEAVPPSGEYGQAEKDQITSAGYTFLQTIYGDDLATDVDAHLGAVVSFGFLAVSAARELVAVIRGRIHCGVSLVADWACQRNALGEGLDQELSRYRRRRRRDGLWAQPRRRARHVPDARCRIEHIVPFAHVIYLCQPATRRPPLRELIQCRYSLELSSCQPPGSGAEAAAAPAGAL
jgi:hypothetical protein